MLATDRQVSREVETVYDLLIDRNNDRTRYRQRPIIL
jgi:hypothetical protein